MRRSCPSATKGCAGDLPQPLVLERLPQPLVQHLAAVEPRRHLAGEVGGVPRRSRSRPGAAPPSPRRTSRRSPPTAGRARARARRRPRSWAAREWPGRPSTVPSSNQCSRTRSSGSSSSSRSIGRPLLRNRSRTTAGTSVYVGPASHSNPSADDRRDRAAQRAQPLQQGDARGRAWPAGPPRRGPEAAADDHDAGHVSRPAYVGGGLHRAEPRAVRLVDVGAAAPR